MVWRFPSFFFIRSYVAIAAGILVIALILDSLLVWVLPEEASTNHRQFAAAMNLVTAVMNSADQPISEADMMAEFRNLQTIVEQSLGVPVNLYQNADFAGQSGFLSSLSSGQVVSVYDDLGREFLYQLAGNGNLVLALGPMRPADTDGIASSIESIVIISYYLLVAVLLYLWIRPFYRDLGSLRHAASQFGRNDFSSRVKVGPRSSILPVAESFNRMAERIQYLVTAHTELTNAVSHELRTPLARFKFTLEILSRSVDPEKRAGYLASMKGDVLELETLIDEMLSYARLSEENLQISRSSVDLLVWLSRLIEQYSGESIRVGLAAPAQPAPLVSRFNPDLMARAVNNVIRNCLRYAATAITVNVTASDNQVILKISDDGPGIPAAMQEAVFEPFSRLDTSRDRKSGGYGLGLAIARRILQRHGGSIHVTDNLPQGAVFVLQWPQN